ncbi:BtrH N-terminal domain-containing protein, partial [Paenibacillus sp. P32E]
LIIFLLYRIMRTAPWIYSNYLNMCLMESEKDCFLDFYAQSPEHHFHPCFTDTQRLLRSTILKFIPDIVEFLKDQIRQDNYIWLHVNEYYIPGSPAYQKFTFPHAIFIYGFDDNEKRFNISGFLENRKYKCAYASYSEIENSFYDFGKTHIDSDVTQHVNYMHLLKLHPKHHQGLPYQFDMKFIAEQIKDYYESKNLSLNYQSFYSHELYSEWTYGIDILPRLIEYYSLNLKDSTRMDIRPFYTLYDYKKLMVARIRYIEKKKLYDIKPMFSEGFTKLENKSESLLNLYIKYALTQHEKYSDKLMILFNELYLNEQVLLEQLLNDFSDKSLI